MPASAIAWTELVRAAAPGPLQRRAGGRVALAGEQPPQRGQAEAGQDTRVLAGQEVPQAGLGFVPASRKVSSMQRCASRLYSWEAKPYSRA
jgi:hypothetical protein